MIHLLLIAENTSHFLNKNFFYFEQELAKMCHLMVWRKSGHIAHILKRLPVKPDFILILNDMGHRLFPMIKGLATINIPTGLIVSDVHRLTKRREAYISKNKIEHIFTVGWGQSVQTYPQLKHKMNWFPHFVNIDIYKDYGMEKDIQLLMIGVVNDYYPLRKEIKKAFAGDARFIYYRHPGYRHFSEEEEINSVIGENYAREINRANIFFTCPSILYYPVMKYFEVLACKTLLLAPTFKELEDLGFVPGKHFVAIDEYNFKEKAAYYLSNHMERQRIANQGYQFIRENHTVNIRVRQLLKRMEEILKND